MQWQNTYLGVLWRQKRSFFWLMLFLIAGHVTPVFLNFQLLTPFYLWSMYTMPAPPVDTFQLFDIRYNDGKTIARPNTYRDLGRMMWTYTLPKYGAYLKTGDTLPVHTRSANLLTKIFSGLPHSQPIHVSHAQLAAYPAWLLRYLQQETGDSIYRLDVKEVQVKYGRDGRPYPVAVKNFLQIP